ncbi:MAG: 30S ribosomal protein S2 [Candidatus Shapirobacteria bacterium]|jgi:small subunit ribosomal protein S2
MEEKKKTIVKTVNRTGKSLVKKALVVKAKKQTAVTADKIKKINEDLRAKKDALSKKQELQAVVLAEKVAADAKADKKYTLTIGLKDLLDAGCHLGHKISKTHPKARESIYAAKDGIQVIDLVKTLDGLEAACNYIYNAKRNGKQIVLVGTKRQAREVVRRVATEAGVPYVTDRWLGGTITNWDQIRKDIKKLVDLKDGLEKGKFTESTKKEILEMKKEVIRLEKIVGGLVKLDKLFDMVFAVDAGFEKTTIKEATMRGVKTLAMVDTDSNPFKVDFAIPTNDDNVKSITIIVEEIGKAIKAAGVK